MRVWACKLMDAMSDVRSQRPARISGIVASPGEIKDVKSISKRIKFLEIDLTVSYPRNVYYILPTECVLHSTHGMRSVLYAHPF